MGREWEPFTPLDYALKNEGHEVVPQVAISEEESPLVLHPFVRVHIPRDVQHCL